MKTLSFLVHCEPPRRGTKPLSASTRADAAPRGGSHVVRGGRLPKESEPLYVIIGKPRGLAVIS